MLWAAGNRDPDIFEDPGHEAGADAALATPPLAAAFTCARPQYRPVDGSSHARPAVRPDVRIELAGPVEWITQSTMRQPYRMPARIDMMPG
jgi:hypothetical protein